MKLIATHPTEGALYKDKQGRTFHVAPDGTQTEIHIVEDGSAPFSFFRGAFYEAVDDEDAQGDEEQEDEDQDKIWIITEWDRSATTILFPSEY